MFTGLIQAIGEVVSHRDRDGLRELTIGNSQFAASLSVGDSVAVSGVCLTATDVGPSIFRLDVARETLRRTTLGDLEDGGHVNLELPLRANDRLGGHFVQGHVDEVGCVGYAGARAGDYVIRVEHSSESGRLVVEKGSIAMDGVSLTITGCDSGWLEVMLIPHTLKVTTLPSLRPGRGVNLEYDILAKYMARFAEPYLGSGGE